MGLLPENEQGKPCFAGSSCDARELRENPALELGYITAPPRMLLYEKISAKVLSVYLNDIPDIAGNIGKIEDLIAECDRLLYVAKEGGRNQVAF